MAVKWAVANGNWNAGATWNDGVVPTTDDVVYCNGHTITLNTSPIDIGSGTITDNVCPNTGTGGGTLTRSGNIVLVANLEHFANVNVLCSISGNTIINGNIITHTDSSYAVSVSNSSGTSCIINGNIIGDVPNDKSIYINVGSSNVKYCYINGNISNTYIYFHNAFTYDQGNVIIVGNVTNAQFYDSASGGGNKKILFTISGNVQEENCDFFNYFITELSISGKIKLINCTIPTLKFYINDDVEYDTMDSFGIAAGQIVLNNQNAKWKYIGNTYTFPFIVVKYPDFLQTYPPEDKVLSPTQYGAQMELVGQYTPNYPPESVVLKDYEYGDEDDRKTGTMEQEVNVEVGCVTPEDVRKDVPLVGMGVVGSLVVPSVDDVREGVHFDNDSVGTLIVQGGGDRLRIADFGYYTNAQSDTYIVDLTEQDKPKFAVAEERVLIEMFPDLDLNNIPEKYFDDLFVKYLKYRLIVEYYRTAGINSTFTPSEPTTEIVNYQNVRNEVWLNSANIYLKAWAKKYPESIVKPQRILL